MGAAPQSGFEAGGDAHHTFVLSGLSLLANEICKNVGAVWWMEPSSGDQLVSGVSHVNPWVEVRVPSFPGVEYVGPKLTDRTQEIRIVKRRFKSAGASISDIGSRN